MQTPTPSSLLQNNQEKLQNRGNENKIDIENSSAQNHQQETRTWAPTTTVTDLCSPLDLIYADGDAIEIQQNYFCHKLC